MQLKKSPLLFSLAYRREFTPFVSADTFSVLKPVVVPSSSLFSRLYLPALTQVQGFLTGQPTECMLLKFGNLGLREPSIHSQHALKVDIASFSSIFFFLEVEQSCCFPILW